MTTFCFNFVSKRHSLNHSQFQKSENKRSSKYWCLYAQVNVFNEMLFWRFSVLLNCHSERTFHTSHRIKFAESILTVRASVRLDWKIAASAVQMCRKRCAATPAHTISFSFHPSHINGIVNDAHGIKQSVFSVIPIRNREHLTPPKNQLFVLAQANIWWLVQNFFAVKNKFQSRSFSQFRCVAQ